MKSQTRSGSAPDRRVLVFMAFAVAVVVSALTVVAVRKSLSDSYRLLVLQGTAFTEALAQASSHAIASEMFFDQLILKRYSDLVASLTERNLNIVTQQDLLRFSLTHDLTSTYIFDSSLQLLLGVTAHGPPEMPPEFVREEISQLFADAEVNYALLTDPDDTQARVTHYYLEMNSQLDRVVVISCDAQAYSEALRQTGIGYLAQSMAREEGVEYIIYQAPEGIIFASRKPGNLLAIESDPFLSQALASDTIMDRQFEFQGDDVLELVRPFSTSRFPIGLFRVGLSLDRYHAVSRGLIAQMAIVAVVLAGLLFLLILYVNSRQKRKELRRKYKQMKSVTDKIFEQMQTGVAAIDNLGFVRLANDAFQQILGIHDVVGQKWSLVAPVDQLKIESLTTSENNLDEIEITLNIEGKDKTCLVVISRLKEEAVESASAVIVLYDITNLKELEQTAARRERLSEMGDMAAGVAHEIRNPLNTISIAAQRLAQEFEPRENSDDYISFTDSIRSETRRLNVIITRFLALAREEQKRWSAIKLDELIGEASRLLKVEAERLGVTFTTEVPSGLSLQADPDKLKQVFRNLFNNAVESFGGEGGNVSINVTSTSDRVSISFSDSGPGIAKELREKVFAPYFTTKQDGTGLGLPTVHRIVTDLNGDIFLEESRWGGTSVVISFPRVGITKKSDTL